jgi:hypothetical protein
MRLSSIPFLGALAHVSSALNTVHSVIQSRDAPKVVSYDLFRSSTAANNPGTEYLESTVAEFLVGIACQT